ncbi:hypothetical protein [Nannocystis sp. SCPEA4]|uniref:hypothetical protein n=1 Tax=Nannocystis sp. SCPEA4 TaxID=2996787 RepID=UPI002271361C|nr:hypothetical protein [Nannocystis sp. SCPEA4]MCY1062120.1 hypothetical protein [Nannocystis sp. SCPEA4]
MQVSAQFATQRDVREAGNVENDELREWVASGLMPRPRRSSGNRNLWPSWAVERARWLRGELERGKSLQQLAELARDGLLDGPSPPVLDAPVEPPPVRIELDSLNLHAAQRRLCEVALERAGSLVGAAALLGIDRHALRRLKLRLSARSL